MIKFILNLIRLIFRKKPIDIPIEETIINEAIKTPEVIISVEIPKIETIEEIIKRIANEEGVEELLCLSIAQCESGLNPKAVNEKGNYPATSRDRGLFQINSFWHKSISDEQAFNPEFATRFFCKAVKDKNLAWWLSSQKCWKSKINSNIINKYL